MYLECRYSLISKISTQIKQTRFREDAGKTDFLFEKKFKPPALTGGFFYCSNKAVAKLVCCNYAVLSSKTLNKESQSILFSN